MRQKNIDQKTFEHQQHSPNPLINEEKAFDNAACSVQCFDSCEVNVFLNNNNYIVKRVYPAQILRFCVLLQTVTHALHWEPLGKGCAMALVGPIEFIGLIFA